MKNNMLKKLTSALCLVMAMCLTFQTVAFAAEATDPTELPLTVATDTEEETPAQEEENAPAEEEAEEPVEEEPQETDPADQPETDPADSSASGEESTAPTDGSQSADQSVVEELPTEEEETPVVVLEDAQNGWAALEDGTLTFWYWENTTAKAPIQAKDEVLYLPEDMEFESYLFKAGCYYFDENGAVVLTEVGIGAVKLLKKDEQTGKFLADSSDEAQTYTGKMVQVTVTVTPSEQSNDSNLTQGKTVVETSASYFTGAKDNIYYSEGELYTGFYVGVKNGKLYYIEEGVYALYTGKYSKNNKSSFDGVEYQGDDLYYYKGVVYDGYWYLSSNKKVYVIKAGKGGTLLTGTMNKKNYLVKNGSRTKGDGKMYSKGLLLTGVYKLYYYKKGVKQTDTSGWKTYASDGSSSSRSSDSTYYFKNGKCVTGWNTLTRNSNKYKFYFNSDGTLCKDVYKVNSAYKKKATKLVISRSTHTATMYAKNGDSYNIACKSFVVSTSKLDSNFKVGTYQLTRSRSWFKIDGYQWWYKWACMINGSGSWTHSEQYYTKGDHKSLNNNSYNGLGTNQSKQCIRMQVVNAKLIYDMYQGNYIKSVVLNKSSNKGPFGKMTVTDNVDYSKKLPSDKRGYEPTDPKTPSGTFKA
jgi:hypothetical protein